MLQSLNLNVLFDILRRVDLHFIFMFKMHSPQYSEFLDELVSTEIRVCNKEVVFGANGPLAQTPELMEQILKPLSSLKRLDLHKFNLKLGYSDRLIKTIFSLQHLTHLNISGQNISDEALTQLGQVNNQLVYINLSNCKQITDEGLKSIIVCSPNLIEFIAQNMKINGKHFDLLPSSCKVLDYIGSKVTSTSTSKMLAAPHIQLQKLALAHNNVLIGYNIPTNLDHVFVHHSLISLKIGYQAFSNELRYNGIEQLINLKELIIKAQPKLLRNEDLVSILDNVTVNLARFSLYYFINDPLCIQLTDETMDALSNRLSNLQCLEIHSAHEITSRCLVRMSQQLRKLRRLSFQDCHYIGDELVEVIIENPHLRELNIKNTRCTYLTVIAFASKALQLPEHTFTLAVTPYQRTFFKFIEFGKPRNLRIEF